MAMSERKRAWLSALHLGCLALAAVLSILFIRSHWVSHKYSHPRGSWQVQLHRGGLYIVMLDGTRSGGPYTTPWMDEPSDSAYVWPESNVSLWHRQVFAGFGFVGGNGYLVMRLPLWFAIVALLIYPIWWQRHPQRRRRKLFGYCTDCGYDLRGSRKRCPECGQPFRHYAIPDPPPPALPTVMLAKPGHIPGRPTDDIAKFV